MIHFIYRWKDPRDQSVKYVGITENLQSRIQSHLGCDGKNLAKDAWIQELRELGLHPILEVIDTIDNDREAAYKREAYWIGYHLEQGCQLFNICSNPQNHSKPRVIRESFTMFPGRQVEDVIHALHAKYDGICAYCDDKSMTLSQLRNSGTILQSDRTIWLEDCSIDIKELRICCEWCFFDVMLESNDHLST